MIRSGSMAEIRTNSELLVALRQDARVPLHRQIETSIRDAIRAGRLPRGSSLPPSRVLAADLGVSRGVVVEAYQQLTAEGYLASHAGGYTQVAAGPARPAARLRPAARAHAGHRPQLRPRRRVQLPPGRVAARHPQRAGRRPERGVRLPDRPRRAAAAHGAGRLPEPGARHRGRPGAHGDLHRLRAGHGAAHRRAGRRGRERLALEDPSSSDDALPAARAAGLEVVGIPVDGDGIRVDLLRDSGADAVILTPSHQWPTGSVLSARNRAAVIRWAAERGAVIIEDDYDAEYRYDRTPVGALQGLAPDHVVYAGSASKTLAPGLRLGWFVLPGHLTEPMAAAKIAADRGSPALEQLALADFVTRGEFDRHLRRMRPVYRRRRDALLAALARHLPWLEPYGVSAGLHLVTWLPPHLDEAAVVGAARAGRGRPGRGGAVPHHAPGSGRPDLRVRDGQRARHRRGRRPAGSGHRRALKADLGGLDAGHPGNVSGLAHNV